MYEFIKKIVSKLIPLSIIKRNENVIRRLISIFYKGNDQFCNICETNLSKFIKLAGGGIICPRCGSSDRNRRLWNTIGDDLRKDMRILHFSPSKGLHERFKKIKEIEYITSDFSGEFVSDKKIDLRDTKEPDGYYDLIICYHVLEHIKEDEIAMKELNRILKNKGVCIIQTPFKDGEIYENWEIKSEAERKKHFGQEDHVRIYSVEGLKSRLEKSGFYVQTKNYNGHKKYGFRENEIIVFAHKH